MWVAAGGSNLGGSAIFLEKTSSSLTVRTCFFRKCICIANDDDGGAIHFKCSTTLNRPISLSDSSFTECSTLYSTNSPNCGGSVIIQADRDGAVYIISDVVTLSNNAFVDCSSTTRAGALYMNQVPTLSLSFLRFRGCTCKNRPASKDIQFTLMESTQVTSDMIQSCDSTSGSPNVYFQSDNKADSTLVPQIDPTTTATIKSIDISFDRDEATVRVVTSESIQGTMGMLLCGSNVPRLVHVEFGDASTSSHVGTSVVLSGANGVLPRADYTFRNAAVTGYRIITSIGHFIFEVSSTLKDENTTAIVVSGANLKDGSYWMLVEKGEKKWNITLTRSESTTLIGIAPLHPSTAKGRLEWGTEYEITKVMWRPESEEPEQDIPFADSIKFTTPLHKPVLINRLSESLGP
ncbi:hypothetical protein BLNAU_14695 [Blattamonas nauphoetae]|uniref:Uncharacterized protein n=1 Tax=Blattamonas nauphoetae TaxID=2049346 RepID=A0ABQ9XG10_9EUKA|nr:hypothetical protein BLNAU_14695 [Blattamonas nauphoetae]